MGKLLWLASYLQSHQAWSVPRDHHPPAQVYMEIVKKKFSLLALFCRGVAFTYISYVAPPSMDPTAIVADTLADVLGVPLAFSGTVIAHIQYGGREKMILTMPLAVPLATWSMQTHTNAHTHSVFCLPWRSRKAGTCVSPNYFKEKAVGVILFL